MKATVKRNKRGVDIKGTTFKTFKRKSFSRSFRHPRRFPHSFPRIFKSGILTMSDHAIDAREITETPPTRIPTRDSGETVAIAKSESDGNWKRHGCSREDRKSQKCQRYICNFPRAFVTLHSLFLTYVMLE